MKKIFLILFLVLSINLVEASKVYFLELNYNNGLITLKDKKLINGYYPDRKLQPESAYKLELISFNNKVLYNFKFEIPLTIYSDASSENGTLKGSVVKLKQKDFALIIPYFEDAKEINIYDSSGEVISVDVSEFSKSSNKTNIVIGLISILLILILFLLLKRK